MCFAPLPIARRALLLSFILASVAACSRPADAQPSESAPPPPPEAPVASKPAGKLAAEPTKATCTARIVVTELHYDPKAVGDRDGEFVELLNAGDEPVALKDLVIVDTKGRKLAFGKDQTATVAPGKTVIVGPAGRKEGWVALKKLSLPNKAGQLELFDACGRSLDRVAWSAKRPWPKHKAGRSLARRNQDSDGTKPGAWLRTSRRDDLGDRATPGWVWWVDGKGAKQAAEKAAAKAKRAAAKGVAKRGS